LIKTIIGVLPSQRGAIEFEGRAIDALPTAQRIRLGIGTIHEGRQLFLDMSVRENLILGAYALVVVARLNLKADRDEGFGST
jgi:ABC-type branched-subunit amino acid transport system ATPase component